MTSYSWQVPQPSALGGGGCWVLRTPFLLRLNYIVSCGLYFEGKLYKLIHTVTFRKFLRLNQITVTSYTQAVPTFMTTINSYLTSWWYYTFTPRATSLRYYSKIFSITSFRQVSSASLPLVLLLDDHNQVPQCKSYQCLPLICYLGTG
jgi:hypothetical protein